MVSSFPFILMWKHVAHTNNMDHNHIIHCIKINKCICKYTRSYVASSSIGLTNCLLSTEPYSVLYCYSNKKDFNLNAVCSVFNFKCLFKFFFLFLSCRTFANIMHVLHFDVITKMHTYLRVLHYHLALNIFVCFLCFSVLAILRFITQLKEYLLTI